VFAETIDVLDKMVIVQYLLGTWKQFIPPQAVLALPLVREGHFETGSGALP
jgi:hypothetical protein